MNQTTIFDMLYSKKKITKPIRLIELFAGYGSQALALKYLGVKFEHWKICEWAIKSIQAYKDIHFTNNNIDYSQGMMKEWISNWLKQKGISSNYNEPMTRQQIDRLNEKQIRTIYNNIFATHNLVNIQQVKGTDLEIVDTDKYEYIMTYSFPCQDLSLAGKGKGMSDTSTRSGMLWEVERILTECHELGNMPQIIDDRDIGLNGINISNMCPTQRASRNGLKVLQNDLRIRKLTPRECFRLMGVKDEDFDKVKKNQSDSSLYHLAGDSIVVNVLMAIFKELL